MAHHRETSDRWLPAFHAGTIDFDNDPQQILFAFSAIGAEAPVDRLMGNLYREGATSDQRHQLIGLLAKSATGSDAGPRQTGDSTSGRAALRVLLNSTADRQLVVVMDSSEAEALWNAEDELLRHGMIQAAGQWRIPV